METYGTEVKMNPGLRTFCPICGATLKNTAIMGMRKDKRSKIFCPYCGRALKEKNGKTKQSVMSRAFMSAVENLEKLAKDRVIRNP